MWIITNMNLLRDISLCDEGVKRDTLLSYHHIRRYWKKTHVERTSKLLAKLLRDALVWIDENGNYFITDLGKERLRRK